MRSRRGRLVAALILIVLGAVIYVVRPRTDPGDREGSVVVDAKVAMAKQPLPRYRVTYTVETYTDAGVTTSTDELSVARPFASRLRSTTDTGTLDYVEDFSRYAVGDRAFYIPPAPASNDQRPEVMLREAMDGGYAEVRETRGIAGRTCQVYRLGDAEEPGRLAPLEDADTSTDVCVDADGLVLEEATFDGGDLVRRRVALAVDIQPRFSSRTFHIDAIEGDPTVVGSVKELEPDSRYPGKSFYRFEDDPMGLELLGRYGVVPAGQPGFSDPSASGSVEAFISEVWTDGPDVLVIEQGGPKSGTPFDPDPAAKRVQVKGLGTGELRYGLRATELRFATGGTRFLVLRGTFLPSRLLAFAEDLEEVPGGPLRLRESP